MTKILNQKIKCAECGEESLQKVVYSVNFSLGKKEDNEKLVRHQQVCPHCGYKASLISLKQKEKRD